MLVDAPDAAAWQWDVTAAHRTLAERDASGARLLNESGPLARLRLTARPAWAPAGRVELSAAFAHARLDYQGRTQAGLPLDTRSHHDEIEAGARWSPSAAFEWGTPAITFDGLRVRRSIAASGSSAALQERSTFWMPGLAWTSPSWPVRGASVALHAQWRASVHHRLTVDYGGLFDPSTLRGGRRAEFALGATAAIAGGWSLSVDWRRARQAASELVPIYRAGMPAGTVHQPRLEIDDLGLTLSKSF